MQFDYGSLPNNNSLETMDKQVAGMSADLHTV